MISKILTVGALVCSLVAFLAVSRNTNGDLNGKWYGMLKTADGGQYPLTYEFKATDGQLSGISSSPMGSIVNGKVAGNNFSFSVPIDGGDVKHTCIYYNDADSIAVDIEFNGKKLHTTLKREN